MYVPASLRLSSRRASQVLGNHQAARFDEFSADLHRQRPGGTKPVRAASRAGGREPRPEKNTANSRPGKSRKIAMKGYTHIYTGDSRGKNSAGKILYLLWFLLH